MGLRFVPTPSFRLVLPCILCFDAFSASALDDAWALREDMFQLRVNNFRTLARSGTRSFMDTLSACGEAISELASIMTLGIHVRDLCFVGDGK